MKFKFLKILFIAFWLMTGFARADVLSTIEKARLVLAESTIPTFLLHDAEAVVVVPGMIKGGFLIAMEMGSGILVMRDEQTHQWSNPSFVKINSGSFGLQAGVQSSDLVLVVRNRRGLAGIMNGTMTLGASGSIAIGPVGAGAQAATDLTAEIYAYSLSRGMFAGISVDGAALSIDQESNQRFYGRPVTTADIFAGKVITTAEVVRKFKEELTRYSK